LDATVEWHTDEALIQLIPVAFSHFLIIQLLSRVPDKRRGI